MGPDNSKLLKSVPFLYAVIFFLAVTSCARSSSTNQAITIVTDGIGQAKPGAAQKVDFRYAPQTPQTVIALVNDPFKTVVGSKGGLCYDWSGRFHTVVKAGLQTDSTEKRISQSIESAKLPIVNTQTDFGSLLMKQQAFAGGFEKNGAITGFQKRTDFIIIEIQNKSNEPQTFTPFINLSSVEDCNVDLQNAAVSSIGEKGRQLLAVSEPIESSEKIKTKTDGKTVRLLLAKSTLEPNQVRTFALIFRTGQKAAENVTYQSAVDQLEMARKYWQHADLPYDRYQVADAGIQSLLDSSIRNIYQCREKRGLDTVFLIGPTCYRGSWAVDGTFISEAVTYLGRADDARTGIMAQIDGDNGPGGVEFSKKAGCRIRTLTRHAQLTGDTHWLEDNWWRIEREVNNIIEYRNMTSSDPNAANFGLMPPGYPDGGISGELLEYSNVYWTLTGLKAAIEAARDLGKTKTANLWQKEYDDYHKTFDLARQRDKKTDEFGNVYVPTVMSGEYSPQRGQWAFLQAIYPGGIFQPDDQLMLGTLAMLTDCEKEGLIYGTGWEPEGLWTYAASFYAHANLWLGNSQKASRALYDFANHASPMLYWREEQNLQGKPEIAFGDMPHNWASAEFIRLIRNSLVLERGDDLHLLEAIPTEWTAPGCKTSVNDIPTTFGIMSMSLQIAGDNSGATLSIVAPYRNAPKNIVLHFDQFAQQIKSVTKNGKHLEGGKFKIAHGEKVRLEIKFAPAI